jgi:GAF domain-containing protein
MVLDVDSDRLNDFDETDQHALERVMRIVENMEVATA